MDDWLPLALNLALVLITGYYASLTRSLSKSSEASAASAAEAAHSAAEAAQLQRVSLAAEVNQWQAHIKTPSGGPTSERDILLNPLTGAYVLQSAVLRDLDVRMTTPHASGQTVFTRTIDANLTLTPLKGSYPIRIDEAEGARFRVNLDHIVRRAGLEGDWELVGWSCEVLLSPSEDTQFNRRFIIHNDPSSDPRLQRLKQARTLGLR